MQKRKQVADAKRARGDAAFKSQMQLEEARRQRLDDEKRVVKEAAQQDVYDTLLPMAAAEQRAAALGSPVEEDVHFIPAPRAAAGGQKIEIAHSDRPFPTPLRESRHSTCHACPRRVQGAHPPLCRGRIRLAHEAQGANRRQGAQGARGQGLGCIRSAC